MSIFTTPLSRLGTADLQELLAEGAVENARLEFKLEAPNKDDTLKKLSSFANTAGDGKVCYVIHTPESDVAPHFLNGRKGVWIRTDEFSARFEARLANGSELRQLFDRRKLIQERRADILERAKKRLYPYTPLADFGPRLDF